MFATPIFHRAAVLSLVLGTTALFPLAASAQTREDCDLLVTRIEESPSQQLGLTSDDVAVLLQRSDFAACRQALQRIDAGQPAGQRAQNNGNITVQQSAPRVTVDQVAPQISVTQPEPNVTVRQPQPEIVVRQPAPVVTVDIPQPEIIVRMPEPDVSVSQSQPQVQVSQPEPQVSVVQPEQPQVQVEGTNEPVVRLTQDQDQDQANVQVQRAEGQPQVRYERAEPRVTVNQAEGQPQIRVEPMNERQTGGEQAAGARQAAVRSQDQGTAPGARGQMRQISAANLEGMSVFNARNVQLGEVENLIRSKADDKLYLVIDHGGFLGLGEKRIVMSAEGIRMQNGRIVVPGLTDAQISQLPEFRMSGQFSEVANSDMAEIQSM